MEERKEGLRVGVFNLAHARRDDDGKFMPLGRFQLSYPFRDTYRAEGYAPLLSHVMKI